MELSKKVKLALEETRILILGAQVLLGFGLHAVFNEGFDRLPLHARYVDGVGLGLLVFAVGLLIAPGPYHRIVEKGRDSGRLHRFTTVIADWALLPFALALGIGLYVGTAAIFGKDQLATAAGLTGAVVALALWYGVPQLRRQSLGEKERMVTLGQRNQRTDPTLQVKIEQLLVEARMILPGAQALFGFQLAIVLTQSFESLPSAAKAVHAASMFLVALAVLLLMAPAPYHRIVYAGEDTEDLHRVGSVLVTAATLPLALGLAGDIYVVIEKISGSTALGLAAGGMALILLIALWYIYPSAVAATQHRQRV